MKLKNLFFLIIIILAVNLVPAQSLDSLITEGLQNNPGIISFQKNTEAARLKGKSAGFLPPPSLGIEFSQVPIEDPDPLKNSLSQNLIISQMFMTGGKLSAMEEAEMKKAEIIESELGSYRLKLIREIRETYYDIWMLEHHIGLRERNLELLKDISESAEQQFAVNRASYSDLLLIKAETASNISEIEVMENELSSMYIMMNSLLRRKDRNTEIIVKHNWQPDTSDLNSDELEKMMRSNNPSLEKMDRMTEMSLLEITANNKELFPDLMIQGMVMRMPRGMILTTQTPLHSLSEPGKTEYMFSIMASVTLPFAPWSTGRISNREEQLLASVEGIRAERQNMELMLTSEFYSVINSVKSSRREMKLLSESVIPLYRQSLESQVTEFRSSRNTINNILQTIKMLIMKEEELAEAVTRHQKFLAQLEVLTAVRINEFERN